MDWSQVIWMIFFFSFGEKQKHFAKVLIPALKLINNHQEHGFIKKGSKTEAEIRGYTKPMLIKPSPS